MDRDIQKELAGFAAVWQRVERGKTPLPENVKLMPRREIKSAAVRFNPQGKRT